MKGSLQKAFQTISKQKINLSWLKRKLSISFLLKEAQAGSLYAMKIQKPTFSFVLEKACLFFKKKQNILHAAT